MLRERLELVEHELQRVRTEAAKLYLEYAIFKTGDKTGRYDELKARVADLEHERMVITDILTKNPKADS